MIRDEPLIYARGERSVYSDLGFMLLGFLVERLSGMALDLWCEEAIVRPLRADPMMFCPTAGRAQLDVDTPNCRCITHSPDRTGRVAQSTLTWGGARRECRSDGWCRGPCRVIRDCRIGAGCLRSLAPRLSWKRVDSGWESLSGSLRPAKNLPLDRVGRWDGTLRLHRPHRGPVFPSGRSGISATLVRRYGLIHCANWRWCCYPTGYIRAEGTRRLRSSALVFTTWSIGSLCLRKSWGYARSW